MSSMVDPNVGLVSYQQALLQRLIAPKPCRIHKELTLLLDDVPGGKRLTYALTQEMMVKAVVICVLNGSSNGKPYFQVGYAVAEKFRRKGLATMALRMSIEELTAGFKEIIPSFYIEAVVSPKNTASLKIAERVLGGEPEEIVEKNSGEVALRYTKSIGRH